MLIFTGFEPNPGGPKSGQENLADLDALVQLHLELPDVLVQLRLEGLLVALPLITAYRENVGQLLVEAMLPMRNLRWMPPIGTRSLIDRFEPFERFERHTGFQLRAVLLPLCRHRPAPPRPLLWTQHAIFITCPVFGVHYKPLQYSLHNDLAKVSGRETGHKQSYPRCEL